MDRRNFLKLVAASSFAPLTTTYGWAFSNGRDDPSHKKLIVIMLRGAIDGMNVVAPVGDRNYHSLRPTIALAQANGAIDLDSYFALHPSMKPLMPLWQDRSLAFVHACGSPDPTRSHFDAQDYMESGLPGSKAASTGWMNRLVSLLPSKHSPVQAISIGAVLPRIFAGPATVATVGKGGGKAQRLAIDRPALADAFSQMYSAANDDIGRAFSEGMSAHKTINADIEQADDPMAKEQVMANRGAPLPNNFAGFGEQVSTLFRKDPSIQVAFLDFGGWDTHVNQGSGQGQLANRLIPLTSGLAALANGLGPLYKNTSIVVMSEFGRTAHENGNGGTDHGHGNAMWLLGGGVAGGKIYSRWAGLAPGNLHEQRDLPTTTDFRSVIASVLSNQMEVSREAIAKVFPDFQLDFSPFVS